MDSYKYLLQKLESFIRRYYINELIRGAILFLSIGLLYFLLTLLVEYFLWLDSFGRQVLFWSFILVEVLLLWRFLMIPLLKLFKLSKGLDHGMASRIIGEHFPEVKDKLLNVLQLRQESKQTELLLAGIEQKALELKPVPFASAVDFRVNYRYLKYAILPVILLGAIFISGNSNLFADSYARVVNYNTAYEPPAPFSFQIANPDLEVRENENFTLQVHTVGQLVPENASINFDGQTYYLTSVAPGVFEYTFEGVKQPVEFFLTANDVSSRDYSLELVRVPRLLDFELVLDYPNYLRKETEVLDGSGNATVPEGTAVEWRLKTVSTDEVQLVLEDTTENFIRDNDLFFLKRRLMDDLKYQISTSNKEVKDYENLNYMVEVMRDQFPRLELEGKLDSLDRQTWYFHGKVSDDYGLQEVQLKYYPEGETEMIKDLGIPISGGNVDEFFSSFPGNLQLEKGTNYEFYFEVTDNDGLRNGKAVKSAVFSYRKQTDEEVQQEMLEQQNEAVDGLDNSLEKMELTEKELEELTRLQKEQGELNYNDRKKLESFLKRQQQQLSMMKNYTEQLKNSLEQSGAEENEMKEQLQERLARKEERLQENEKLLEELEKYSDKIQQEDLARKLEELSKKNQNQEKNLEQLLELTKRYYVTEKTSQLSRELEELSDKQEQLSEQGAENTKDKQDSLNQAYEELKEEMKELEEENEGLKEPMELGMEEELKQEAGEEQQKASDNLEQQKKGDAKKNQKNAAGAMKKMAGKMKQQQQMSGMEQMQEDSAMLRQILDNLIVFSFEQEELLEDFKGMERNSPQFAGKLRRQNLLKEHFRHVDDSLYSLALRNPMITENITEKLTDIEYDLDKALERLADNEIPQGIGSQQYVITGANDLANFLSDILQNMQQQMQSSASGSGVGKGSSSGKGEGEQLPDLIKKQGELSEEMKEGIEKGKGQGSEGGEEMKGELFEIFKEQQMLRKALEEKLEEEGLGRQGDALKKEMEQLEEDILEKGFSEEVLQKMQQLEHKLLDLEDARLQEGQKEERESNTNNRDFGKSANNQILRAKEYFNTTEILNRQSLPLRQNYQQKVREYFERRDH